MTTCLSGEPGLPDPAGPHLLPRLIMHHLLVSEVSLHVNSFAAYKSSAAGGSHNHSYIEKTWKKIYEIQHNFKMSHDEFVRLHFMLLLWIMIHFLVVRFAELLNQILCTGRASHKTPIWELSVLEGLRNMQLQGRAQIIHRIQDTIRARSGNWVSEECAWIRREFNQGRRFTNRKGEKQTLGLVIRKKLAAPKRR